MEEETRSLLSQCSLGCKMALNSIEQIQHYIEDKTLERLILDYKEKHEELENRSSVLLKQYQEEEKEPGALTSAFSWFSTEIKLMLDDTNTKIAKLMMDGCNMGIQSIGEALHKYANASMESQELAKKLVQTEETFMKDLTVFL